MKLAIINGQRSEATKKARGLCPGCGSELIAKCGEEKINHWAHKGNRNCDQWWENETDWHREWKNCFDAEWQEVVHKDESTGEIHIADVRTPYGWTIEFQRSPLVEDECKARNTFYKKIVWVVDGTRRKTDIRQLSDLLSSSIQLSAKLPTYAVNPNNKNRLLTEWRTNESLIFFDFRQVDRDGQRVIWFVQPTLEIKDGHLPEFINDLFISAFPVRWFVETHFNGVFDQFFSSEIQEHVLQFCRELYNIRRRYKIGAFPDPKYSWLVA